MTVERGDDRLAQAAPLVEHLVPASHPLPPHVQRLQRGPFIDVGAHAEGLVARTGEHDHTQIAVGLEAARQTLEFALLADGVDPANVYTELATQEGADRAFKALDKIKDEIFWWDRTDEPMTWLSEKKVAIAAAYSGRMFRTLVGDRRRFGVMWDGQIYSYDMWVMPLGTPNKEAAMQFLEFIIQPQIMADFAVESSYAPARRSAIDLVPDEVRSKLATANATNPILIDRVWWADHMDAYTRRFENWLQQ